VGFVFAVSSAAMQSQVLPLDAMVAGARCQATIRGQIGDWGARFDAAIADPPGPTGLRSVRMPTDATGIWIRVAEEAPRELIVERITATRIERLRFDEPCRATESAVATPSVGPGAFTDSDLILRVAREERGVFLLWSPHMPLSVDQHAVLADVARELGLVVVPLLDPNADRDYAARVVSERGLAPEAARPLGGIELAFRGMTTHTPSLQVFAGGSLVGPVLYGYRSKEALRAVLDTTLAAR
jgi:hypothetical protein